MESFIATETESTMQKAHTLPLSIPINLRPPAPVPDTLTARRTLLHEAITTLYHEVIKQHFSANVAEEKAEIEEYVRMEDEEDKAVNRRHQYKGDHHEGSGQGILKDECHHSNSYSRPPPTERRRVHFCPHKGKTPPLLPLQVRPLPQLQREGEQKRKKKRKPRCRLRKAATWSPHERAIWKFGPHPLPT